MNNYWCLIRDSRGLAQTFRPHLERVLQNSFSLYEGFQSYSYPNNFAKEIWRFFHLLLVNKEIHSPTAAITRAITKESGLILF